MSTESLDYPRLVPSLDSVVSDALGREICDELRTALSEKGMGIPVNPHYIAFGVGQAVPEEATMGEFAIQPMNVTFVDKHLASELIDLQSKGVVAVEEPMFAFLAREHDMKYDLATAFGIEFLLDTESRVLAFARGLAKVLRHNGIVIIYPTDREDRDAIWRSQGFEPLPPNLYHTPDMSLQFYVYTGISS